MGVSVSFLDSTDPAPASVAAKQMVGCFTDAEAIKQFVKNEVIDVLTVEIEHINVDALEEVQRELGTDIQPTPSTLRIIQDKYAQKEFFEENEIAVVDFKDVPDQVRSNVCVLGGMFLTAGCQCSSEERHATTGWMQIRI